MTTLTDIEFDMIDSFLEEVYSVYDSFFGNYKDIIEDYLNNSKSITVLSLYNQLFELYYTTTRYEADLYKIKRLYAIRQIFAETIEYDLTCKYC